MLMVTKMEITDKNDLKIGCAVTFCCHLDLEVIENESRLQEIQNEWNDEFQYEAWETAKEAYLEIAERWPIDSSERLECINLSQQCKPFDIPDATESQDPHG